MYGQASNLATPWTGSKDLDLPHSILIIVIFKDHSDLEGLSSTVRPQSESR